MKQCLIALVNFVTNHPANRRATHYTCGTATGQHGTNASTNTGTHRCIPITTRHVGTGCQAQHDARNNGDYSNLLYFVHGLTSLQNMGLRMEKTQDDYKTTTSFICHNSA
jgi:hypothetical protein